MTEITVAKQKTIKKTPFVVNMTNDESGEVEKYEYEVTPMGGRTAMEISMMNAEFARSKDRQAIVGGSAMRKIISGVTAKGKAPDLLDLLDLVDDKGLEALINGLAEAAKKPTTKD